MAFSIIPDDGEMASKSSEFTLLEALGFKTPFTATCHSVAEVEALYAEYIATRRAARPYLIDGLVIQVDATAAREALGDQGRGPLGAVAWKFPSEQAETTLRGIDWQVGKSGRITPVAVFDTVNLAGVRVSRANLHNVANIKRLWGSGATSHVGDIILASRRGDVIPQVEEIVTFGVSCGVEIPAPKACPECATKLVMDGEYLVCRGEDCPAQIAGSMRRWVEKIGVLHFGNHLIEALVEAGLVADIADLYTFDVKVAEALVVDGRTIGGTATKGHAALHAKKDLPLHTILGSLGIPLVGRSTARTILDGCGAETFRDAYVLRRGQVEAVHKIGEERARNFYYGLRQHEVLLAKLLAPETGVTVQKPATGALVGQTFCMSGGRWPDLAAALEAAGAAQKSSVGKGLTFLIVKDPHNVTGKVAKAFKLGIKVVSPDDAQAMI